MDLKEFIEKFADAVEVEAFASLSSETRFRELDEWSSLAALSIIAMLDEEYDVSVSGDELRKTDTIGNLYDLMNSKK